MVEPSAEVSVGLARIEGLFRESGVPLVESWAPGLDPEEAEAALTRKGLATSPPC